MGYCFSLVHTFYKEEFMSDQTRSRSRPSTKKGYENCVEDYIVCPWCGEDISDLDDYDFYQRECIETECGHCDKTITLCINTTVSYTCHKG